MDLPTIAYLQQFLVQSEVIVVFVSHDRGFLNTVSTDIVEMKDLSLIYFPGNYDEWVRNKEEMFARRMNAIDAKSRKEAHIQKTIEAAHARGDDRLAKTKQKKLERAAFTRSIDGHRFKLFSLAKMDEAAIHMPEIIEAEKERYQAYRFKFPVVDTTGSGSLRLSSVSAPLLTFDKVSLSYVGREKAVLENLTLSLTLQSRVGIIGRNGKGKSTLMLALAYAESLGRVNVPTAATVANTTASSGLVDTSAPESAATPAGGPVATAAAGTGHDLPLEVRGGKIWKHHNLKIGVVAQHQIDILSLSLYETPVTYIGNLMGLSSKMKEAEIRSHLGAFGLGGSVALQKIGSLSGGQKARLSFAAVCASRPHLLFLDEPTNHLSIEAIDCLIDACQAFTGGIVIVSHNKYFLSQVCTELFVVNNQGTFSVRRSLLDSAVNTKGNGNGSDSDEENDNSAFVELLESCIQEQMRG